MSAILKIQMPTDEEEAEINAGILSDPDTFVLNEQALQPTAKVLPEIVAAYQRGDFKQTPQALKLNDENQINITQKTTYFYKLLQEDKHHRYMSWEHCYSYFKEDQVDIDKACLHMAFYLASWGMYRGSSFLLWKDYLIHKKVVEHLIEKKHLQNITCSNITDDQIKEIIALCEWIKEWYTKNAGKINGTDRNINVTNTLATKIVLGTLGCIPAYDRYFIAGLKVRGINPYTPSFDGIKNLISFYKENQNEFDKLSSDIKYPSMKIIDMYFWQIGFDEESKKEAEKQKNKAQQDS